MLNINYVGDEKDEKILEKQKKEEIEINRFIYFGINIFAYSNIEFV